MSEPAARYSFGDGDVAARRLALVAEVFEAPSRALLADAAAVAGGDVALAVDLGCGPGWTTRLLASVCPRARVVGLDASADFVGRAVADGLEAVVHDVTAVPFPTGPADLVYARLLLSHLLDVDGAVAAWSSQVRSGGVLALEDVESIDTDEPVLRRYLTLVEARVVAAGGPLYAGPRLASVPASVNRVVVHDVPTDRAAAMFSLNFAVWGDDPALAGALAAVSGGPPVRWRLRQVVVAG